MVTSISKQRAHLHNEANIVLKLLRLNKSCQKNKIFTPSLQALQKKNGKLHTEQVVNLDAFPPGVAVEPGTDVVLEGFGELLHELRPWRDDVGI